MAKQSNAKRLYGGGELDRPIYTSELRPSGILNLTSTNPDLDRAMHEDPELARSTNLTESILQERIMAEWQRKIGLLYAHYGVPQDAPNAAARLVVELAFHHVPGMKVVDGKPLKPGPKPKWLRDGDALVDQIKRIQLENNCTLREAAETVAKRNGYGLDGLLARYHEAIRRKEARAQFAALVAPDIQS